jgi:hypothetical protein
VGFVAGLDAVERKETDCLRRELNRGHPSCSLVFIHTDLSRLLGLNIQKLIRVGIRSFRQCKVNICRFVQDHLRLDLVGLEDLY